MTLVIAEVSSNHAGSIDNALGLIAGSAKAGADFVKFQLYNSENDIKLIEKVEYQDKLRQAAKKDIETISSFVVNLDWLPELAKKSEEYKISLMFSCSDETLLELAKKYSTRSIIKIASCDATNLSLLAKCTQLFEEIIISTGAISTSECLALKQFILNHLKYTGKLSFLYCVSEYPTASNRLHLSSIEFLRKELELPVGYSDHTKTLAACMASLCFEPYIIEKHIMIEDVESPDSPVSCTTESLSKLMEVVRLKNTPNSVDSKLLSADMRDVMLRRSPYTTWTSEKNLSVENYDYVRPGCGMSILEIIDRIDPMGMLSSKDVRKAWGLNN